MELYAALDVSLQKTSVCVLDRDSRTVLGTIVTSEALAACLAPHRLRLVRGLAGHGLTAVLMWTRQVRAALSAMTAKTDRGNARGLAHLLRLGWFRPVHVKTLEAREVSVRTAAPGGGSAVGPLPRHAGEGPASRRQADRADFRRGQRRRPAYRPRCSGSCR
jgi:transposase